MNEPKRYALMGNPWEMVEHKNGNLVSYEDYARLKAEVELLKENPMIVSLLAHLRVENARLKAEVERLTKAGDAMAKLLSCCGNPQSEVRGWNAAKGVQS